MPHFQDSYETLFLITLIGFFNGAALSLFFACCPRVRCIPLVRVLSLAYMTLSLVIFSELVPPEHAATGLGYWCFMVTATGFIPILVYVLSTWAAALVELITLRELPSATGNRLARWQRRILRATRLGQQRLLDQKLLQLQKNATDPTCRQELIDLYCRAGESSLAAYHAYALVEMLPRGHAHGFALYRLCQILVDRLGRLDSAQPYLRRIIRMYPRSYFASYARRLVNQYEAYVDREV